MKKLFLFFCVITHFFAYEVDPTILAQLGSIPQIQDANTHFSTLEGDWMVIESDNPCIKLDDAVQISHSKKFYFAGENCYTVTGLGLSIYPSEVINSTGSFS